MLLTSIADTSNSRGIANPFNRYKRYCLEINGKCWAVFLPDVFCLGDCTCEARCSPGEGQEVSAEMLSGCFCVGYK